MTWLFIALMFIAAFGPILWLMPGKRERRLSKLRMQARQRGLVVEMTRIEDAAPARGDRVSSGGVVKRPVIRCAAYRRHAPRPLERAEAFRVERDDAGAQAAIGLGFEHLPPDWLAVERDAHGACVYWREQVGDETLGQRLDGIENVLNALVEVR